MKRLLILIALMMLAGNVMASYPVPLTGCFDFGAGPETPDSVWIILAVDESVQSDSVKLSSLSRSCISDTLMRAYSGEILHVFYRGFAGGVEADFSKSYSINYLRSRSDTVVQVTTVATVTSVTNQVSADVTALSGDATAADNLETMLDGTGGAQLTLKRLQISGANSTSGSFYVENTSGTAMIAYASGGNGSGVHSIGDGSGHGILSQGDAGGTGGGMTLIGGSSSGIGLSITGYTYGMRITGSDTGLYVLGVSGADIAGDIDGTVTPTDTNASGEELALMPDEWNANDTAAYQGSTSGLTYVGIDSVVAAIVGDSGLTGGCSGTGTNLVKICFVDSSGTDTVLTGKDIELRTLAGARWAFGKTLSSGYFAFSAQDHDTLTVHVSAAPHYVHTDAGKDTIFNITADVTDTTWGYNMDIGTPGSADLNRLYFYLSDLSGNLIYRYARAIFRLKTKGAVEDTCGGTYVASFEAWVRQPNASTGVISIDLTKNKCFYGGNAQYSVEIVAGGSGLNPEVTIGPFDFTAMDSTSQRLRLP